MAHDFAMKIFFVIPGSGKGAEMIFARCQADAIEAFGNPVFRFFMRSRTSFWGVIKELRRLRREIRAFAPDVIHCHYGTMTAFLVVCATTRPIVITYRGSDLNPDPDACFLRAFASRFLSQLSSLFASRIICVSGELAGRLWLAGDRVAVIPTGVDTKKFSPVPKVAARNMLGWDRNRKVVLFNVGRAPKVKRLDLAEMAVSEAKKIVPDIELLKLFGDVDPDLMPVYHNAADVLLLTSDYEGSPTVVQEAISCGLPVVSVDVGDVRERLLGVSPSKIVPRDSKKLGAALAEIISLNRRSNGADLAHSAFGYATLIPKVLSVLENAAQSKA